MPDTTQPVIFGASMTVQNLFRAVYGRLDVLEANARVSSQGSMTLLTPETGAPDITSSFQPITFFDTIPYERGVDVNTVTGEFTFNLPGEWALFYRATIAHASTGSTRTVDARLFNVTEASAAGKAQSTFIASNQSVSKIDAMLPFALTTDDIGDTFRFEVGNASTNLTTVDWNSSNLLLLFLGDVADLLALAP